MGVIMKKTYFLIGIKGTGMSALAQCLFDLGHIILGSDVSEDYKTSDGLMRRGIKILPFNPSHITDEYIYIIGNAYDKYHEEVSIVLENKYPHFYYHEFLAQMPGYHLAISGTHGKTTTTTLIKEVLSNQLCAYVIGDGNGGAVIDYDYFIYEACEYRNHFLSYYPDLLVINNIEHDHPDFFHSLDEVISSFKKISDQAKMIVVNGDDVNVSLIEHKRKITFGFKETNDYIIKINNKTNSGFDIMINNEKFKIPFVGLHMIYNSVASYVVGTLLGLTTIEIQAKILKSNLPKRRMEIIEINNLVLVDDYAHHPTEIKALYEALSQKYPHHTINAIFQPHTYSRTFALKEAFVTSLKMYDKVYLENVFTSSREQENLNLQEKVDDFFLGFQKFNLQILKTLSPQKKEVWVFLGAGIVNRYLSEIVKQIHL